MKIKGHAIRSTTAPSKPQPPSINAVTDNSITLIWPANTEPNIVGYNIHRSTDGINYQVLITDLSTNSYTDINLQSGQIYYYVVRSKNSLGQVSEYSITVSQETTSTGQLTWSQNLPSLIEFSYGTEDIFDLDPYISGSPGSIIVESGTLPSGVTVVNQTLSYDGAGNSSGEQQTGILLTLVPATDQDWITRSSQSGVFYSNNFTYRNTAKTEEITSVADLISSAFQTGNTSRIVWDQSLKLSGNGCLRLNMPGGSYNDTGWTFAFDGFGNTNKTVSKQQFYLQFAYYADSIQNNFNYGGSSSYGGKICIVQAPDASFGTGEVVFRRWVEPGGFVGAYSLPVNDMYYNNVTSQSKGLLNNLYDANHYGASLPSPSTASQWKQRHGYMSIGTVADPDYVNAPRIISNTWMTIEMYIDLINDCVKIWMAPYGQAPKLLIGRNAGNGDLPAAGTSDSSNLKPRPLYTGAQLTNYANSPTAWPSSDTFVCYDEIIVSDNPINFPGGYTLPFPGTNTVTNWPWSGTVFRG